jgi:hypothetical protein
VAATDTFESFNALLSEEDRKFLAEFTKAQRNDLLTARSEDERVRLVQKYVLEVMEKLR